MATGNSDHNSAIAPVTKGAATLVPERVIGGPPAFKLVTASPGAARPRLPIEMPRLNYSVSLPSIVQAATGITQGWRVITELQVCPDCPPPDNYYAASRGLIKRILQSRLLHVGGLRKGEAQVDQPRPGVNAFDDGGGKLLWRCAWHLFCRQGKLSKNGSH